jgi:hypothetical protein
LEKINKNFFIKEKTSKRACLADGDSDDDGAADAVFLHLLANGLVHFDACRIGMFLFSKFFK